MRRDGWWSRDLRPASSCAARSRIRSASRGGREVVGASRSDGPTLRKAWPFTNRPYGRSRT
jgi:hypothetical protein